jgi:hypothetical protein
MFSGNVLCVFEKEEKVIRAQMRRDDDYQLALCLHKPA